MAALWLQGVLVGLFLQYNPYGRGVKAASRAARFGQRLWSVAQKQGDAYHALGGGGGGLTAGLIRLACLVALPILLYAALDETVLTPAAERARRPNAAPARVQSATPSTDLPGRWTVALVFRPDGSGAAQDRLVSLDNLAAARAPAPGDVWPDPMRYSASDPGVSPTVRPVLVRTEDVAWLLGLAGAILVLCVVLPLATAHRGRSSRDDRNGTEREPTTETDPSHPEETDPSHPEETTTPPGSPPPRRPRWRTLLAALRRRRRRHG